MYCHIGSKPVWLSESRKHAGCWIKIFSPAAIRKLVKIDKTSWIGAKFSRKEIDELTEVAKAKGAKGLAYIVVKPHPASPSEGEGNLELQSPIVKFLGDDLSKQLVKYLGAKPGDIIFFGADSWKTASLSLGAVRNECALRLGLKDNTKAAWCWVVDFPMYDYSEIEEGKIDFGKTIPIPRNSSSGFFVVVPHKLTQ